MINYSFKLFVYELALLFLFIEFKELNKGFLFNLKRIYIIYFYIII